MEVERTYFGCSRGLTNLCFFLAEEAISRGGREIQKILVENEMRAGENKKKKEKKVLKPYFLS
jgi:hypothetical protein